MRYELKKLLGFREIWVGGLLLTAYLLFAVITESSGAQDWPLVYQFITRFGSILFPGFLIIGLSRLFCYEYNEHTEPLIHACKSGKKKTFQHKIGISALYAVCIAIFIAGTAFIVYMLPVRTETSPSASFDQIYSVLNLSNVGLYSCQVLLMIAGGLPLIGFILLLSVIVRRGTVVMFISGALYGSFMIYNTLIRPRIYISHIFLILDNLFKYNPVNLINLEGFGCGDFWSIQDNYMSNGINAFPLITPLLVIAVVTAIELAIAYVAWTRRARK